MVSENVGPYVGFNTTLELFNTVIQTVVPFLLVLFPVLLFILQFISNKRKKPLFILELQGSSGFKSSNSSVRDDD